MNTIFHKVARHMKWFAQSVDDYFKFKKVVDADSYIFISQNADSAGGAPVVLLELIRALKGEHNCILLCEKPGKILDICHTEGIPAFSMYLMEKQYIKYSVKKNVKCMLVNTLAAYKSINIVNALNPKIKLLWWVHEERNLIERYKSKLPLELCDSFKILCVSETVRDNMINVYPYATDKYEILYYGCKDLYNSNSGEKKKDLEKYTISVIGRICERKNQLQVVRVCQRLPEHIQKNVVVQFVAASYDDEYLTNLEVAVGENENYVFTGAIPRNKMPALYENSDLIICPSIDDPLPVVVTEAMMLKCLFITSSCTGQYSIVDDGINGYSYRVESDEELLDKIIKAYNCSNESILNRARDTYLKYFCVDVVKNNFKAIILER